MVLSLSRGTQMSRTTSEDLLDEFPSLRFDRRVGLNQTLNEDEMADEFPGNSQRRLPGKVMPAEEKAPEKVVTKVVSGTVERRKPSLGKRFKNIFLGGDTQSVKDYVVGDVIVPALKDTIADAVTGAIERIVFGENARPARSRRGVIGQAGQFNYAGISARNAVAAVGPSQRPTLSRHARMTHTFDEVIFPTRADAEAVLSQMFEMLDKFEVVTVSDFLELSGVSGNFTDHKFGWVDLRGIQARRSRGGGYILDLPPTEPID